jgi:hypothetical protein
MANKLKNKHRKILEKVLKGERDKWKSGKYASDIKWHLTYFRKQFNKHLSDFITAAFALIAALLWRDAINSTLNSEEMKIFIKEVMPFLGDQGLAYATAFAVTVVAVLSIITISKLLKVEGS